MAKMGTKAEESERNIEYDEVEQHIKVMGYSVAFPQDKKPFPAQLAVMSKVLLALKTGQNALIESPTGTGKTLALLCSTLTFQRTCSASQNTEWSKSRKRQTHGLSGGVGAADSSHSKEKHHSVSNIRKLPDILDLEYEIVGPNIPHFLDAQDNVSYEKDVAKHKVQDRKLKASSAATSKTLPEDMGILKTLPKRNDYQLSSTKVEQTQAYPTIFFCSRTHSQLAQVIDEFRKCPSSYSKGYEIKGSFGDTSTKDFKMSYLSAKTRYCVHPEVTKVDAEFTEEKCRSLLSKKCCSYYKTGAQLARFNRVIPKVWDIEELCSLGKSHKFCPYYYAMEQSASNHVVFCPYNYIFDPLIQANASIYLRNAIIVLDEAHNIEDICRSNASIEITEEMLYGAINAFENVIAKRSRPSAYGQLLEVLLGISRWLDTMYLSTDYEVSGFDAESKVWSGLDAVAILYEYAGLTEIQMQDYSKDVLEIFEMERILASESEVQILQPSALNLVTSILSIASLMLEGQNKNAGDFRLLIIKSLRMQDKNVSKVKTNSVNPDKPSKVQNYDFRVCIWCLSAAVLFRNVSGRVHSIILTSGTLAPMDSFVGELGVDFKLRLEANHVVNMNRQVFTRAIMRGPGSVDLLCTYQNQQSPAYQDSVGSLLAKYAKITPGGMLMFLPSYAFLDRLVIRWKRTRLWKNIEMIKSIFIEPRQGGKQFDALLNKYKEVIAQCVDQTDGALNVVTGAIFLGVYRGKVSEGIDFANAYARAVFAVGIPFPSLMDRQVSLKRKYQDEKSKTDSLHLSGNAWYQLQAFRAFNQAIGRCIRHSRDHGAIFLLDSRHRMQRYAPYISKWLRHQIKDEAHADDCLAALQVFFQQNAADLPCTNKKKHRRVI